MTAYVPKLTPYPHQQAALDKMRGRDAFALLMAMRTGKTKVIIDELGEEIYKQKASSLLLIAPAGVYRTWEGEFEKHWPEGLHAATRFFTYESGMGRGMRQMLDIFINNSDLVPHVLLVNVEALSGTDLARDACVKFLQTRPCTLVIDESTTIKTPSSARTKFVLKKLRPLAARRRILSGLPAPRSPLDLFSQFYFLDPAILRQDSYWTFRRRYGVIERKYFGGRSVDVVTGYQNTEELQGLIEPYSYRVTLDQVRDALPPVYGRWDVDLTPDQRRAYEDVRDKACTQLANGAHVSAMAVISQIVRLQQILCGHVADENDEIHEIPEKRTEAVIDALADYDGKAIIWTRYDLCVKKIHAAIEREYGEGSCARFWGGNINTREAEERRFKQLAGCRFMVATQAAGGRGRTWDVADLHIFHANSFDLEHRDQAEQRAEGATKTTSAARIDLVSPGTVDEKIIASLRAKIDLSATVTGDAWREWLV